jgi:hypothetical protein
MIFNIALSEMPKALSSNLFKHFLRVAFYGSARGRALAETLILSLTSGDTLLGKGSRIIFGCYDRGWTLEKVTSGVLLLRSGFG